MRIAKLFDDYSPGDVMLKIIEDDQGDYHISLINDYHTVGGLRIASSGTRYDSQVRKKIGELMDLLGAENL